MKIESQFVSSSNKGFQMSFPNGWTVSVQFGPSNYAEIMQFPNTPMQQNETWSAEMAEISAWHTTEVSTDKMVAFRKEKWNFGHDTVQGWQSTTEVLEFINMIASLV